jgi:hypothetical protein
MTALILNSYFWAIARPRLAEIILRDDGRSKNKFPRARRRVARAKATARFVPCGALFYSRMIQFVPSESRERATLRCGMMMKKKMYMYINHSYMR